MKQLGKAEGGVPMRGKVVKNGFIIVILGAMILMLAGNAFAQEELSAGQAGSTAEPKKKTPGFIAVPIPIFSDVIGTGLGVGAAVLYQTDAKSKTSGVGLGGFYTNTESWGVGGGISHIWKENKYKVVFGGAFYNLNLDFYGIGSRAADQNRSITLNQNGWGVFGSFSAAVAKNFYLGMSYRYLFIDTSLASHKSEVPRVVDPGQLSLGAYNYGPGLSVAYDSRDSNTNPQSGVLIKLNGSFPTQDYTFTRNGASYSKYKFEADFYAPLADNMVLAFQVGAEIASDAAPFYDICNVGIRGYQGGKYRDDTMLVTQLEWRWRFYKRFGLVVFGGAAEVNSEFRDFTWADVLPAGGVGFRYMASKKYGTNISIDYGWGKDGNQVLYIGAGEAF
jgi:hypothetical protein